MKLNRFKIELIVLFLLSIAIGFLYGAWKREKAEKIRFKKNQETLMSDVVRYKTSDSLNVLEVGQLTLTNREFKDHNSRLMETVDKLNLKVRRLERASETGTVTVTQVKTIIKDSIIYRDKQPVIIKCIDFDDGWVSASGCVENGLFDGKIISRDTLQQFAVNIPKRFIFIKFGSKGIKQTIVSSNPHTKIEYHKEIIFKK
jgi:hypothetical protein